MERLSFVDRQVIELNLKLGKKSSRIAEILHRDHTVIDREIKRNSGEHLPYSAERAQSYTERRVRKKNIRKLEQPRNADLLKFVEERLKELDSPEQIAGKLKRLNGKYVCHETIYDYLYNGQGQYGVLFHCLRRGRPKRRVRGKRVKQSKISIPERVSIDFRPETVELKKELGHWEADSMIFSKQKPTLGVLFERMSFLCRLQKNETKEAQVFENGIHESLVELPAELHKSVTRDNGSENAKHLQTKESFGIQSFFCDTYSSWQKGGVENLNGLIRQYFPKKFDFAKVTKEEVYWVQEKLNNRPRKSLGYLTPNEFIALRLTENVH